MQNSPSQEHAAAIIEVAKIANHRFDDLVADASPILGARAANLEATPPLFSPPGARQVTGDGEQTDGLRRFNGLPVAEARAALASCLAVPRWVDEVSAGRPYHSARRGVPAGPGVRGRVLRRRDRRGPGPAPPDRGAGGRGSRRGILRRGAGRRRARRPGHHRRDPGRERRVREQVQPGVRDQGGRPVGHRDPGRTAPPAEQHRRRTRRPRWSPNCGRSP